MVFAPNYWFQILEGCESIRIVCSKRPHSFSLFNPSERFHFRVYEYIEREDGNQTFQNIPKLKQKPYWGNHFWPRGYFVSTVYLDESMIRRYVKYQAYHDSK